MLNHIQLFATPWTVALQAHPWDSSRKTNTVGCHSLLQGSFPTQGLETRSPESPALAGGFFTTAPPGKPWKNYEEKQRNNQEA